MRARGSSGLFVTAVLVAATLAAAGGTASAGPVGVPSAAPARATAAAALDAAPAPATARPAPTQALRGPQAAAGTASSPVQAVSVRQAQAAVAAAATLSRTDFTPVTPVRTLDTRNAIGAPKARVAAGRTITVQLTGRAGVPATGVGAVALSLTSTGAAAIGFLTAYPAGAARPGAYSVTYAAGQNGTNLAVVKVSATGQITLFTSATTDIVADVHGWYATTSTVHALTPARLLDTRTGNGAPAGALATNGSVDVQVTGRGGVPATGVVGAVLNLTGISSPTAGSMALFATGTPAGIGALNLPARSTVSNLLFTRLGTGGKVTVLNRAGTTHATVDVVAWIGAGGQTHLITPERSYDTRATGATGPIGSGGWLDVWMTGFGQVPVLGVHAVVANVTVVNPPANGTVVVHQQGLARPGAVSISYLKGRTTTTQVVAFIGAGGWIRLDNVGASVNFIVDTVAWYSADGSLGLAVNTPVVAGQDSAGVPAPTILLGNTVNGSADGRYTVFRSNSVVSPYGDGGSVSIRDNLLGLTTQVVSGVYRPGGFISGDGNFLIFGSADARLWTGDTNATGDAFWYDLQNNRYDLVTRNRLGAPADLGGGASGISANGRYVVLFSHSANITADQAVPDPGALGVANVFVRDTVTGTTVFVGQTLGSKGSAQGVSDDGRIVVYQDLVGAAMWDRTTRTTRSLGGQNPTDGFSPAVSPSGRYVAFPTTSPFAAADLGGRNDIYALDRTTDQIALVSHTPTGADGNRASLAASVADDGTVVFMSAAGDLLAGTTVPALYRGTAAGGPVVLITTGVNQLSYPGATNGTAVSYESGFVGPNTRAMVVRLR